MKTSNRVIAIVLMTLLLGTIVAILLYASEDPRFGHDLWETWLIRHIQLSPAVAGQVVFICRKTLHFLGYGGIGLLFWAYFSLWGLAPAQVLGIVTTGFLAALDEYTQTTSSFRGGNPGDVLLDLCGALVIGLVARGILKYWHGVRQTKKIR